MKEWNEPIVEEGPAKNTLDGWAKIIPPDTAYRVWQLDAKRENRLIARPVSMIAAHRLVAQADPLKYTYALLWVGEQCTYLFGKIANQLSDNDHRVAAYKLLARRRK